eukprot:Sdes_comp9884_c0_seq1m1420
MSLLTPNRLEVTCAIPSFCGSHAWSIEPGHLSPSPVPQNLKKRFDSKRKSNQRRLSKSLFLRSKILQERESGKVQSIKEACQRHKKEIQNQIENIRKSIHQRQNRALKNRQNILKDIIQRCSKSVQHAKFVSQQQKISQILQREQKREQLDKKLMNSERRRKRKLPPLLSDTSSVHREKLTRKDASLIIQNYLRACFFLESVKSFRDLGIHEITDVQPEGNRDALFDKLSRIITSKKTIQTTNNLLSRISKMTSTFSTIPNSSRVFLSAYMINLCPEQVFSKAEIPEMILQKSSRHCVEAFHKWTSSLFSRRANTFYRNFVSAWNRYCMDFVDWKEIDKKRLVDGLLSHLSELEALKQTISGHPETERQWNLSIESQKTMIEKKLSQLGVDFSNKKEILSPDSSTKITHPQQTASTSE